MISYSRFISWTILEICLMAEVMAVPVNLAPGGTAACSSVYTGSPPSEVRHGIDGNRNGDYYSLSVWHTAFPDVTGKMFFEVDLGTTAALDRVMIWPRTDLLQHTLTNFRLLVRDTANAIVWQKDFLPTAATDQPWGTSALRGVRGRTLRLERLSGTPDFMTFAEFEVWGQAGDTRPNLAQGKPTTSSPAGANSTPLTAGNDGDLGGDYTLPGRPIFLTQAAAVGQFWEVDLGVDQEVDYVVITTRTDAATTSDVRVSLRDASNTQTHSATANLSSAALVNNGRKFDVTHDIPGIATARYVRIETLAAERLAFGELEVFGPGGPPALGATQPAAGETVAELVTTLVEFTQEVTGLEAEDLLINGFPASSVTSLEPQRFRFRFPQPTAGPVVFSWAAGHGITAPGGAPFPSTGWSVTLDPALPVARPVITEFLALNDGGRKDQNGDSSDWIEIHNPGPLTAHLGGWFLTDSPDARNKWTFPDLDLPAGAYVIVFASGKNRTAEGSELHTNFKLSSEGGYLALVRPDGVSAVSEFNYPAQRSNVSYGTGREVTDVPLLAAGAQARLLVPTASLTSWQGGAEPFDDSGWASVTTGVGFEVGGSTMSGLLGWWNFNDSSSATTVPDASGHNHPGTVIGSAGGAVFGAAGSGATGAPADRAMVFNGAGGVKIGAASAGLFDPASVGNAVTFSLWVKGGSAQPSPDAVLWASSDANGGDPRQLGVHLPWSDSVIYWDTGGCCAGDTRISIGEPNPALWRGTWNHYAFLKRGNEKEIWQNGFLIHSGPGTTALGNVESFFIGAFGEPVTGGYHGSIDDVAVWDTALTGPQITALAHGGSPLELRQLTPLIASDVRAAMDGVNASAWLRIPFTVAAPSAYTFLTLRVHFDDGFVAFLNGVEIARRAAPTALPFNAAATSQRSATQVTEAEEIDLSDSLRLLKPGSNMLAFHALNASLDDGDFVLRPELAAGSTLAARFFQPPTPAAANGSGSTGFVTDTHFSPGRGFYDASQSVVITCETPGALIRYTTDGSDPTAASTGGPSPLSVPVTRTTVLRARAFGGAGSAPSNIDTHTYLFLDGVAGQQRPASVGATWPGGAPADFVMDARVPGPTTPGGITLRDALRGLPTLSVVLPPEDIWGSSRGLYANSSGRGQAWERAAHAELLDPAGGDGFHIRFGLRVHGNISRDKTFTPKHSFKMFFRGDYGAPKLDFPLFPDSTVTRFDELILRGGSTDTWPCTEWGLVGLGPNGQSYYRWLRIWASYIRDQWVRDAQIAMGQPSCHGRFVHLYLNGLYWGLYNLTEHPDADFASSHLGGSSDDWDALADFAEIMDGDGAAWSQLIAAANADLSQPANYQRLFGNRVDGTRDPVMPVLLNEESLIDYIVLHIFIGADDWPNHNWWALRQSRNATEANGFRFFAWDQEISNVNAAYGRTSWGPLYQEADAPNTPAFVFDRLAGDISGTGFATANRGSAEFRMHFADRVQRHLFNAGALTQEANVARWNARTSEIDRAIVGESARWGDHRRSSQPYRRETEWLTHLNTMATQYWPKINAAAIARYRAARLFPVTQAPQFSQLGGEFQPGFALAMTNQNPPAEGTLYFTTDGSDPRLIGGAVASAAQTYAAPVSFTGRTTVMARVLRNGEWSPLTAATFLPDPDLDDDGMLDAWESAHGLDPGNAADAIADPDSDGQTTLAEFRAGTNPHDPKSLLAFAGFERVGTSFYFRFHAVAGRSYHLERSDDLVHWEARDEYVAGDVESDVEWTEPGTVDARFYRLVVRLP